MKFSAAIVLSVSIVGSVSADETKFSGYGSLGYAFEGTEGFEIELGAYFQLNKYISLRASPLNVVFYDDPDDGFYTDSFSNGQNRCRNENNGQFANDEECVDIDYRGALEGQVLLFDRLDLGGGALISDDFEPYGSIAFRLSDSASLKARAGENYASVAFSFTFR